MKVLFGSYHNISDLGSGAAISARSLLRELVQRGAEAATVSGAFFDGDVPSCADFLQSLRRQGIRSDVKKGTIKRNEGQKLDSFQVVHYNDDGVDSTAFLPEEAFASPQSAYDISLASSKAFHRLLYDKIAEFSSDVFLSYGAYRTALNGPRIARRFGATTVFYLCNHSYRRKELFNEYDACVVPSEHTRKHYRDLIGLDALVLPPIIDEARTLTDSNTREFVTLINLSREKGLFFFLGIARELEKRRPEIPLLVVESRTSALELLKIPGASALSNLHVMKTTTRPSEIYARTRITLVPSLCEETFGRVAVESALNGIPVLTSGRGALSEVLPSEFCLPIPKRFTPFVNAPPTPDEVAPWVDAIIRLWDDDALALRVGEKLKEATQKYRQERVAQLSFETFAQFIKARRAL
ncbi:MAG: glycosyltransferase family 4 protein [Thermoguttaceae bacterium]|nr:glycosyltransferase family 4 protein [Thermoguttaceae bacterium]